MSHDYTIIEPDGTTSIVIYKTRNVGATTISFDTGQEYHKRLPDGSTQKLTSRYKDLAFHEAGIINSNNEAGIEEKMNNEIKTSLEELVAVVTDEFDRIKEVRRKARNKRKAAKRKGKK